MRLEKLWLENFRCYQELELDLHPNITMLVANNGEGKTAILDAVRIALWPYISQFDLARLSNTYSANSIKIGDVRLVKLAVRGKTKPGASDIMVRRFPSSVTAQGHCQDEDITWRRYRDSEVPGSKIKHDAEARRLRAIARQLQKKARNVKSSPIDLPVFAYYGTGRLWKGKLIGKQLAQSKTSQREKINMQTRTFAYRDCFDSDASYRQFEDWFTSTYLKIREYQIRQFELDQTVAIDNEFAFMHPIKVIQDAVNEVLKPVGWHTLEYSLTYDRSLILKHADHGVLKVAQLSDGIKNIVTMVADIAYRCVLLNEHLGENAARQSTGIVMIDEIDMHLHPKWQQTVVDSLCKAFPKIQFIATTHSPQVLSTLHKESIRVISHGFDADSMDWQSSAHPPYTQSRGVASADVMAELQAVDPVPDVEEAQWLTQYQALIIENQHETKDGAILKGKILDHFGEDHHEWLECERLIRLQAMKAKLRERTLSPDNHD